MAHLKTFFFPPSVFLLFSLQAKKEFEPPTQFIKILYQQVFLWLMLPHFPFGVLLALVMWFVQFHIDAFVLTTFNAKPVTETHCNTLQHSATHCNTLQHTATHCNTLQHAPTLCSARNILQHTATHFCVLWFVQFHIDASVRTTFDHKLVPATHCTTLQRAATRCVTMQHTATNFRSIWFVQFHIDAFVLTTLNIKLVTTTHYNTLQHAATH